MEGSRLLDDLDPDQRRAVTTESNLVAVIAGAGSGKTRVLTRRVAYRIHTGTADARHTLVLTFTREAAGELRRRLPQLGLRDRVEAGTFHAVMLGVLRQHWTDRRRSVPTVVADRRRLVAEAVGDARSGRAGPRQELDEVVAEIDWASARAISPERYATEARRAGRHTALGPNAVAERFEAYRTVKRRRGVIDLDDILQHAADVLEGDADAADVLRWRFRHLLVDEAQDLNPLQHRLVDLLRQGHDDLFLVGDPAQAIYGFNGADPGLLIDVADRFPGVEVIRLATNHRSTPQVVRAGVHVLASSSTPGDDARSSQPAGPPVRIVECEDETDEARRIARLVNTIDPALVRRGEVAVLARTHGQLAAIREALAAAGVEIRRRVDAPGSPHRAAIDAAVRLGSAARLRSWAHDALDDLAEHAELARPAGETSVPDRRSHPRSGDAGGSAITATVEVATVVLDFLREDPLGDGVALRAWIASTDPFGTRDDVGVDVATFHASKGREWHTVVVSGVETGLVPHRSASTIDAKTEEARLLHVAFTRARDQLVVTWAKRRGGYRRRPSPLVDGFEPDDDTGVAPPVDVLEQVPKPVRDRFRDELQAWRAESARGAGVLPEQFCSDATLRQIDQTRPASADELADATGIGVLTARRWYPGIADLLRGSKPTAGGSGPRSGNHERAHERQGERSTITGA